MRNNFIQVVQWSLLDNLTNSPLHPIYVFLFCLLWLLGTSSLLPFSAASASPCSTAWVHYFLGGTLGSPGMRDLGAPQANTHFHFIDNETGSGSLSDLRKVTEQVSGWDSGQTQVHNHFTTQPASLITKSASLPFYFTCVFSSYYSTLLL